MSDEWVMVPRDLLQRVDAALQRHLDRHAPMRIPVDQTDSDLVQSDVQALIAAPAAPQQAEPALNERVGLAYKNGYEEALNDCIRNGGEAWARSMFANGGEHIKPQQAEPVAWVRNLTDPQPHCVTGLQYRTAADADAGVQYIPVYLHPPAAEVQRLRDALTALLDHYVSLVASGDAGKWDAEQEPQVIAARRALGGE